VQVKYTFTPGTPDVWYLKNGYPGDPSSPPEIEITDVLVERWTGDEDFPNSYQWTPATPHWFAVFSDYAMDNHFDDMVAEAIDAEQDAADDAAEQAAEARAEMRRDDG
jgi:hypothetical protein